MTHTLHRLKDGTVAAFTDAQFEDCVKEGFSRTKAGREAAAWWILEALPNRCGGDRVTLMHDFPQHRKHLLAASAGRVIEATPELAIIDGWLEVIGVRGDTWMIEVYGDEVYGEDLGYDEDGHILRGPPLGTEPIPNSGQVVITVDSAQGVGKTNSVVLATDKRDRRPLAAMWDNLILHDDLARVAHVMLTLFAPREPDPRRKDSCTLIIERDGPGITTQHELRMLGVPFETFSQSKDDNSERCITQAKRRIEEKPHGAPLVMAEECDELQRDEKKHLKGRKDCLMMYGCANVWIDQHPFIPHIDVEAEKDRNNRMSYEASLRDHLETQQGGAMLRPKWGA